MLLRGAFSLNFYRDFMGLPATKNRPLPVGMAGFVERCIFLYLYGIMLLLLRNSGQYAEVHSAAFEIGGKN